jgi:FkbM family methyltransferase
MFDKVKQKIKERLHVPSQPLSFKNIKKCGFDPKVIFDIGAYEGKWTEEVMEIFPGSKYYLFEAQESKRNTLHSFCETRHHHYTINLLGAEDEKEVVFNEYETASSVFTEHFLTAAVTQTKKLYTLDTILKKNNWPLPDFVKIDTQGYEVEILKGANGAINHAEAILLEVSFIDIYKSQPLAIDVVNFMDSRNFQVYDICTLMRRPLDNALFQADILFVKKDSKLVADKRWGQ